MKISNRFAHAAKEGSFLDHKARARGGGDCLLIKSILPRIDKAHIMQTEIRHGARGHADIFAKLRFDKNDDRRITHDAAAFTMRKAWLNA